MKTATVLFLSAFMAIFVNPARAAQEDVYSAEMFYANPHEGELMISFDWDDNSNLYYSTGDPDWDVGFAVYRYNGVTVSNLYTDAAAFAGGQVTAIGGRIYFNDGGTYERWTSDYYIYDPSGQQAPVNMGVLSDLYSFTTHDGTDFWAVGGWSSAIYYSALTASGELSSNPLVTLGNIGTASGPVALDDSGNLYYAEGYVEEGTPSVYRWSSVEVSAAIADPEGSPLTPDGHVWATLSTGSGASGMAFDKDGNLLVTVTSFIDPSELHRLLVTDEAYAGYEVLLQSDARLATVKVRWDDIYVSSSDGIFKITSEQIAGNPVNDYNGDGKSDMAVYNQANGNWYVRGTDGNAIMFDEQWGGPGFTPVAGDFTGDGQSDLAVYHQATGNWYIRTVEGTVLVFGEQWGGPGFTPVAGDFTGDGQSDLAVYHQATGNWYIRTVEGTVPVFGEQWGGPDFTPVR